MIMVLEIKGANWQRPNPPGARGRNSPIRPAMPQNYSHEQ
jgi:hypothetical protein